MNIDDIHVQPEWLGVLSPMMELSVCDGGLIVLYGCIIGRVHLEAKEIEVLAELQAYHGYNQRYVHEAIFKALGYTWVRPNTLYCDGQKELFQYFADIPEGSCESVTLVHPGMFANTWPNAEADFRQCSLQGEDIPEFVLGQDHLPPTSRN